MTDPLAGTQLHGVDKSLPLSNEDFLKLIINQSYIIDEVKITNDLKGLEATRLISFLFMSGQAYLGGVKVHLHHSTRNIQIQEALLCLTPQGQHCGF